MALSEPYLESWKSDDYTERGEEGARMDMKKLLFGIMILFFALHLGACTYYMDKPAHPDFYYPGNLIERDLGIDEK